MNAPARTALMDVTTQELEYQRIGGKPQLARLYRPKGDGPFPAVVGVHGGAWTSGDRNNNQAIDQALAAVGVVVLALDLRLAPQAPYPASVADVNFGIRWLKAHSAKFGSRPDWVGTVATSSGGQQTLLSAMRPRDPRYAAAHDRRGGRSRCGDSLPGGVLADLRSAGPLPDGAGERQRAPGAGAPRLFRQRGCDDRGQSAARAGARRKRQSAVAAAAAGDQGRQRDAGHGRKIRRRLPRPRRTCRRGNVPGPAAHRSSPGSRARPPRSRRSSRSAASCCSAGREGSATLFGGLRDRLLRGGGIDRRGARPSRVADIEHDVIGAPET